MAIYEIQADAFRKVEETSFGKEGIRERADLQRLLRANVGVISPDTRVIAEEFGEWEDSRRRVDLLGIDKNANLVVNELKRDEDGAHMELQAIRYAAMVSTMTFERASGRGVWRILGARWRQLPAGDQESQASIFRASDRICEERGRNMNVVAYEGVVENGQVRLPAEAKLPENAKVYVVVPALDEKAVRIYSPRLLHPEQAPLFEMEVIEESKDAGL